jgi:hypothetical protein
VDFARNQLVEEEILGLTAILEAKSIKSITGPHLGHPLAVCQTFIQQLPFGHAPLMFSGLFFFGNLKNFKQADSELCQLSTFSACMVVS